MIYYNKHNIMSYHITYYNISQYNRTQYNIMPSSGQGFHLAPKLLSILRQSCVRLFSSVMPTPLQPV